MFARFHQTPSRLQISLRESRRIDGKPRCEHIASLGSIPEPMTTADRVAFWARLYQRLAKLSNRIGAEDQEKFIGSVHARIPMVTIDDMRAVQRENAEADEKFWSGLQGMDTEQAEGHKELAAKSARIAADAESRAADAAKRATVAKDRIERLAKGEAVSGGLSKPMTRKALLKASGVSESFMRHCERVHELSEMGLFEEYVRAGQDGMLRGAKSAERKFLRRHRPER
jgi:hypothetical protein